MLRSGSSRSDFNALQAAANHSAQRGRNTANSRSVRGEGTVMIAVGWIILLMVIARSEAADAGYLTDLFRSARSSAASSVAATRFGGGSLRF